MNIFSLGIQESSKNNLLPKLLAKVENIDKYSLDDIEAKLSIICVRNKVNFDLDDKDKEEKGPVVFNFNDADADESVPAWVKAAANVAKNME